MGDVFETEGTWYGGVHISGRTGVPVSLDKEEYTCLLYTSLYTVPYTFNGNGQTVYFMLFVIHIGIEKGHGIRTVSYTHLDVYKRQMSVFKEFGYELPRVAAAQYESSQKKELSDIEVGDLVFYGSNIYHVGLYIGDEKIIHASTSASGIKVSDYDFETPSGVGTYLK